MTRGYMINFLLNQIETESFTIRLNTQDRTKKQNEKSILLKQKEAKKASLNNVSNFVDQVFIWS